MKKRLITALVGISLLLIFILLAFVPAYAQPAAPKTIKIGAIYDITGPSATFGARNGWAYRKFVELKNKEGGIFVKEFNKNIPIEFIEADHQVNPEKTVLEAERLSQSGVVVITGTTAVLPAGAPVCEKNRVPLVTAAQSLVTPHEQGFRYLFCVFLHNTDFSKWPFEIMESIPKDQPKLTKIGFMEAQHPMGIDYSVCFQKEAKSRNFSNYIIEKFQWLGKDLTSQIQVFKQAGVDFVYAPMLPPDAILFIKQSKQLDFNPKAMLIVMAPADRESWLGLGKDGDLVLTNNAFHASFKYPGAQDFTSMYMAERKGEKPYEAAGCCWAAMQVIADAIERAGSLERDKIRDALDSTDLMTIVGRVKYAGTKGMGTIHGALVQYQNGVETVVMPKELMEKPMIYPLPNWKDR